MTTAAIPEEQFADLDQRAASKLRRSQGLYSLTELAAMIGMPYLTVWNAVEAGYIPQPKSGNGKRKYYDRETLTKLVSQLAKG